MSTAVTMPPQDLLDALSWRYATKKFDPTRTLPGDLWAALEQALVLTPSSYGLQPWKFVVVTDPDLKRRLRPASWNQTQVEDCSHLVVFLAKQRIEEADIDRFLGRTAEVRGQEPASLAGYRTVCACPAGFRSAEDAHAAKPKVRYPLEEVIDRR